MPMPDFTAGRRVRASELNTLADQIDSLTSPPWTSYTPAWSSSGTVPAIGNGTITGRYRRPANADEIDVEIRIVMGSTTTYGTGFWTVTMPVNPSATSQNMALGIAYFDDTGTLTRMGGCRFNGNLLIFDHSTLGVVGATVPHTWANTDVLRAKIRYQPA